MESVLAMRPSGTVATRVLLDLSIVDRLLGPKFAV